MRLTTKILILSCTAAAAMFAQQGRLAGPVTGYVFDSAVRGIRPVMGVPGASMLGDRIALGYDVRTAAVSPRLDAAIAVADDGSVHFLRIDDGTVSELPVAGDVLAQAVVFSPGGSAAALYSNDGIQVVTGLPGSPKLRGTIHLGAQAGRTVRGETTNRVKLQRLSYAVSDDGEYVLFAGAAAVRLLGVGGEDRDLVEAANGSLVAFAPNSRDAAIADARAGVFLLKNAAGSPVRRNLAGPEMAAAASGLAFGADGSNLLLTNAERAVSSFDVASGERRVISCECSPSRLTQMGRVFRLNDAGNGPLWLFDAAAAEPRTVFVPAAASAN